MEKIAQEVVNLLEQIGLETRQFRELPGRPAKLVSVPVALDRTVAKVLDEIATGGLFSHQAVGISQALAGKDVCLATPTASGKSLVFMSVAAQILKSAAEPKLLALYPAKALIQDQLGKWRQFLARLGIEPTFIDGSVPPNARPDLVARYRVVLMTPDVAHAWLLSHLEDGKVK